MLELPDNSYFGHIIKKLDTSTFLEDKMGVTTKSATKMIIEGELCSVLKK